MALSDAGVVNTRNEVNTLNDQKAKLNELLDDLEKTLKGDENFQKFCSGTKRGDAINNNLLRIIDITKKTITDTEQLVSSTTAFLDKHEIENKKGLR